MSAATAEHPPARVEGGPGWSRPLGVLGVGVAGLGVALLAPRAFSDPVSVDPFDVRLAATTLLLFGAALAVPALAPARAVICALASIAVPWTVFLAAPRVLAQLRPGLSGNSQFLWTCVLYSAATLAFLPVAWRVPIAGQGPRLRLTSFPPSAWAVSGGGVALLLLVGLAIPATLLGRVAVEPDALARDLPWLGPASVLQAAAQEIAFRGLLLGVLERRMPRWGANLSQAMLFGLAHVAVQYEGPAVPFVPVTVLLGLLLGLATQRTGSLWPAIIVHAVAEVAVVAVIVPGLYGY